MGINVIMTAGFFVAIKVRIRHALKVGEKYRTYGGKLNIGGDVLKAQR